MSGPMPQEVAGEMFRGWQRVFLLPAIFAAAKRAGLDMRYYIEIPLRIG